VASSSSPVVPCATNHRQGSTPMFTVLSLYRARIKEFVRDRWALFWTFAFPVIFIVLFGLIFSGSSSPSYTVGLVNEDGGAVGNALAQTFEQFKPFTIKTGTREAEVDHLKKRQIDLVIVIPSGLSQAVASGQTAQVQVVHDPSGNPATAQIVVNIVQQVLPNFNSRYTHVTPPLALPPPTLPAPHVLST